MISRHVVITPCRPPRLLSPEILVRQGYEGTLRGRSTTGVAGWYRLEAALPMRALKLSTRGDIYDFEIMYRSQEIDVAKVITL